MNMIPVVVLYKLWLRPNTGCNGKPYFPTTPFTAGGLQTFRDLLKNKCEVSLRDLIEAGADDDELIAVAALFAGTALWVKKIHPNTLQEMNQYGYFAGCGCEKYIQKLVTDPNSVSHA